MTGRVTMREDADSHEDLKGCGGTIKDTFWCEEAECEVHIILWDAHTYDGGHYDPYVTEECTCSLYQEGKGS